MNFELKTAKQINATFSDKLNNFEIVRQAIIENHQVALCKFETNWYGIKETHTSLFIYDQDGKQTSKILLEKGIDCLESFEQEEVEAIFDALLKGESLQKFVKISKSRS